MALSNPSIWSGVLDQPESRLFHGEYARARDAVDALADFVQTEHLTIESFQAYWRRQPRAMKTLHAIGRTLGIELGEIADEINELLGGARGIGGADLQGQEAAQLFVLIDGIAPDEYRIGDGRAAAEKFQYAVEARRALLRYTLAMLNQRFIAPTFANLNEATGWTRAFAALLQDAEQVIRSTQELLYDEATAIQSHLDTLHLRFQQLDRAARASGTPLRGEWPLLLENAEIRMLERLADRHEQLAELTLGELREARESGWLQSLVRNTPLLGSLLLTVIGGSALLSPGAQGERLQPLSLETTRESVEQRLKSFPVLPRRYGQPAARVEPVSDAVHVFFNAEPRPGGRQSLEIVDSATLTRVLDELAAFGYPARDVLELYGLRSVDDFSAPITLDVRWSQGDRPLLLPPFEPAETPSSTVVAGSVSEVELPAPEFGGAARPLSTLLVHHVVEGESLDTIAARYGSTVEAIRGDNRQAAERPLRAGQILLVRVSGRPVEPEINGSRPDLVSRGGFPLSRVVPAATPPGARGVELVDRYGSTLFPSIEAMPEDARHYFTTTVQEVADFFNVRPGDIIGILQAENNNAGLRLHQPTVSSAGARGVAQVVPRTWNGWSNPATESHLRDLRAIEAHGGIGFDWSMRDAWRAWRAGESDGAELAASNADPDRFENGAAAIARHLVQWGLTRDHAATDPARFERELADAISVYNSGRTLDVAEEFRQSEANHKTTGQYVREAMSVSSKTPLDLRAEPAAPTLRDAYARLMDESFGIAVGEQELADAVDRSVLAADVAANKIGVEEAARQLLARSAEHYIAEGRAARAAGLPLPWPYVENRETLEVQRLAARTVGHVLPAWELDQLFAATRGDPDAIRRAIQSRADARLVAGTRRYLDETLQRTARGLAVSNHEVAALVQPVIAGHDPNAMSEEAIYAAMAEIESAVRKLPEYRAIHGAPRFSAAPLAPMPGLIRGFHEPVNYQKGGLHTGIDIANPRVGGEEPLLYAVEAGTVVHVGHLYCASADACRGGQSIVIDHGDQVYSIYSHNSVATVQVGQRVRGGEPIGRQGNEGYSFGSHLHFEVHTGAPFSGDWERPFAGGQFEDPTDWLPQR